MFSKSCKYAIRAVLFLATRSNEEKKIGVDELSVQLDVPRPFLAKILQQLSKNNHVSSTKGRNGGFYLSTENKQSNLIKVIETIDGPEQFSGCVLGLLECSDQNPCPYHGTVQKYRKQFFNQLKTETIEESALRIDKNNLRIKNSIP